jgi:K+-transporting ATPase A subunit
MDSRGQGHAGVQTATGSHGFDIQMFAGAGLGIAAQAFLARGLIFHVMPWVGLDLLDMARAVADFDLPMRIGQLFAGFLALK